MFIWLSSSKEEDLEEARREGRNKGTFITTLSLSLTGIKCRSRQEWRASWKAEWISLVRSLSLWLHLRQSTSLYVDCWGCSKTEIGSHAHPTEPYILQLWWGEKIKGERDPFSEEKGRKLAFDFWDNGCWGWADCLTGQRREREGRPEKFLSSLHLHFCTVASAIFPGNLAICNRRWIALDTCSKMET